MISHHQERKLSCLLLFVLSPVRSPHNYFAGTSLPDSNETAFIPFIQLKVTAPLMLCPNTPLLLPPPALLLLLDSVLHILNFVFFANFIIVVQVWIRLV